MTIFSLLIRFKNHLIFIVIATKIKPLKIKKKETLFILQCFFLKSTRNSKLENKMKELAFIKHTNYGEFCGFL